MSNRYSLEDTIIQRIKPSLSGASPVVISWTEVDCGLVELGSSVQEEARVLSIKIQFRHKDIILEVVFISDNLCNVVKAAQEEVQGISESLHQLGAAVLSMSEL